MNAAKARWSAGGQKAVKVELESISSSARSTDSQVVVVNVAAPAVIVEAVPTTLTCNGISGSLAPPTQWITLRSNIPAAFTASVDASGVAVTPSSGSLPAAETAFRSTDSEAFLWFLVDGAKVGDQPALEWIDPLEACTTP